MNERVQILQQILEENIELFLANNKGKLVFGAYGDEHCACALNTVLVNVGEKTQNLGPGTEGYALRQKFSRITGKVFYFDELLSFVRGFDGFDFQSSLLEEFYDLGLKLAAKYQPIYFNVLNKNKE